jgi:predicted LPLAT superfamily acyltransferase
VTGRERWVEMAEVGSAWAMRFAEWFHRRFGRGPSLVLAALSAGYFWLRNGAARRASARYLARVEGAGEGGGVAAALRVRARVLRHFAEFAICVYDRMVAWGGGIDTFELSHDGSERIFELAREGTGALLLGAHVGTLDLLGFIAAEHDLRVTVVAWFENAARINHFLGTLGADRVHLIHLEAGGPQAVFQVRAAIERGEFVVVMADRRAPGTAERTARVGFLGREARFPLGPFELAAVLGCPVHLALCLRDGNARYTTYMREVGEARRVGRGQREERARELLGRYAKLLEEVCHRHPLQWFNFFDFWEEEAA